MGKKPLIGLVGLVTAGMLVTAGCDCCHKNNTRPSGDNYKAATGYPKPSPTQDKPAPIDPTQDKQSSPPAPLKPPFEQPEPLPTDNKMSSMTQPSAAAPTGVQTLKQGFERQPVITDSAIGRTPSPMSVPSLPQRPKTNEIVPASMERLPGTINPPPNPLDNHGGEPLPPITNTQQPGPTSSLPPNTLTAPPPPMPNATPMEPSLPGPSLGPPPTMPIR